MAYPIILRLAGAKAAVIGGGAVARRKVGDLIGQGAEVTVTAPEVDPGLEQLISGNSLTWHRRGFEAADLDGCLLAFAATDNPAVNRAVATAAAERSIPVNVADAPDLCTFTLPASLRRGKLLISVSTGGGSPLLAARVRDELAGQFDDAWADYVALLARVRSLILARGQDSDANRRAFAAVLEADLLEPLRNGDRAEIDRRLKAACGLAANQVEDD